MHATLCHDMSGYVMLCHAMADAMLSYTALCYAMLHLQCHGMLRYAMPNDVGAVELSVQYGAIADKSTVPIVKQQPRTVAMPKQNSIDNRGVSRLHSIIPHDCCSCPITQL